MMPQCLADDRDRDMIVSCHRCPGMAGNIEGELALESKHSALYEQSSQPFIL